MDEKEKKEFEESLTTVVDQVMEKKLSDAVGPIVAKEVAGVVQKMKIDRALTGRDITGLSDEQKINFAEASKAMMGIRTKANEAIISEQDSRGGYLVPQEVANAILRIAQSVGIVMGHGTKWSMGSDELAIPAYTGSFLEGEFLGFDAAGSVTAMGFAKATLVSKKWQLAFAVANDVLSDAVVNLADWLLAIAGETVANMTDKQALAGTGAPFVGVLNHPDVAVVTLPTGEDTFAEYRVIEDSANVIAQLEESLLPQAGFIMHRTTWALLRQQKSSTGDYLLPMAGAVSAGVLASYMNGGGPKPVGEILGFPVFTTRHYPSSTAVSTKFITFGSLPMLCYGDRGDMTVEEFRSGTFSAKEIALADQRALVFKKRLATVVGLAGAFVNVKTAAS